MRVVVSANGRKIALFGVLGIRGGWGQSPSRGITRTYDAFWLVNPRHGHSLCFILKFIMKHFFVSISLACSLLLPLQAAILIVGHPFQQGAQYSMNVTVTNNDTGAVYDSARTDALSDIIDNGILFNSSIDSPDVFNGWTITQSGSELSYTRTARSTVWDNDSNSNDLTSNFTIANTELELNASSGHQAFTLADVLDPSWNPALFDAIIVRSDHALLDQTNYTGGQADAVATFTATQDIDNSWSDTAPTYLVLEPGDFTVVPEPASAGGLLGLAGLAFALVWRRR